MVVASCFLAQFYHINVIASKYMNNYFLLEEAKRLKAIADVGLLYCTNEYDRERYIEIQNISLNILGRSFGWDSEQVALAYPVAKDYPTAKVDVRGLLLNGDKILLVRESADGKWSLPGGWADIGFSAKEVIIKEFKEETGIDVVVKNLLAVFDKRKHPHPPQPFYVYKMVFYCEAVSHEIQRGFDVLDAAYFSLDELPPLSEDRILQSQITLLYNKIKASDFTAYFD